MATFEKVFPCVRKIDFIEYTGQLGFFEVEL